MRVIWQHRKMNRQDWLQTEMCWRQMLKSIKIKRNSFFKTPFAAIERRSNSIGEAKYMKKKIHYKKSCHGAIDIEYTILDQHKMTSHQLMAIKMD